MQLPKILAGPIAKPNKKNPSEVVTIFSNSEKLEELSTRESGNSVQCYVAVSPGEKISLKFAIPCGEAQIVDLFVDGILRESNFNNRHAKVHQGKFLKVFHCERRASGAKGKVQHFDMVVENRVLTHDARFSSLSDTHSSEVGTFEIRVLRQIPLDKTKLPEQIPEQANRGITFENNSAWWEASKRVELGVLAPSFQIGPRDANIIARRNIRFEIIGYYLWASFKFNYRDIADLETAGFKLMKQPSKMSSRLKTDGSVDTNYRSKSIGSTAGDDREQKQIVSPDNLVLVADDEVEEHNHIKLEPSSLTYKNYTENSKERDTQNIRTTILPPGGKRVFGDNFPIPVGDIDRDQSDSEGTSDETQTTRHGAAKYGEFKISDGIPRIGLPHLARRFASMQPVQRVADQKPSGDLGKEDHFRKSLPGAGIELSNFREIPKDIISCDKPELGQNQTYSLKLDESSSVAEYTPASPVLESLSQGHPDPMQQSVSLLQIDSNLVTKRVSEEPRPKDPNAPFEDPSFTRETIKNSVGAANVEASQKHPVTPIKSVETQQDIKDDHRKKRKFDDLISDDWMAFSPQAKGDRVSMSRSDRSMSPRLRREEYARRKKAKLEALENAKTKTEALRKQVSEFELKQAEEAAEEEKELEALDRETENFTKEYEGLKAELQELQDK